jgi:hypothetical protein
MGMPGSFRNAGIFAAWIAGILLLGSLAWFFTKPVRDRMLLYSVNRVLTASGLSPRLEAPILPWRMPGKATQLGRWYTLAGSEDWGVVFSVMIDGIPVSFFAAVSPRGAVNSLVPLSNHSVKALDRLAPETLRIYTRRIGVGNAALRGAMSAVSQGRTQ